MFNYNDGKPSERSDFPVLEPSPLLMAREIPVEDQIKSADIVVDVTVLRVYPMEIRKFIPAKGSLEALALEKAGGKSIRYAFVKVEMQANDYMKGNAGGTFEMTIAGFNVDSIPDFQVGNRFLLTLADNDEGGFTVVTPVSSYFFIADDDKVYPAGNDTPTSRFSGMDLSDVKRDFSLIARETI